MFSIKKVIYGVLVLTISACTSSRGVNPKVLGSTIAPQNLTGAMSLVGYQVNSLPINPINQLDHQISDNLGFSIFDNNQIITSITASESQTTMLLQMMSLDNDSLSNGLFAADNILWYANNINNGGACLTASYEGDRRHQDDVLLTNEHGFLQLTNCTYESSVLNAKLEMYSDTGDVFEYNLIGKTKNIPSLDFIYQYTPGYESLLPSIQKGSTILGTDSSDINNSLSIKNLFHIETLSDFINKFRNNKPESYASAIIIDNESIGNLYVVESNMNWTMQNFDISTFGKLNLLNVLNTNLPDSEINLNGNVKFHHLLNEDGVVNSNFNYYLLLTNNIAENQVIQRISLSGNYDFNESFSISYNNLSSESHDLYEYIAGDEVFMNIHLNTTNEANNTYYVVATNIYDTNLKVKKIDTSDGVACSSDKTHTAILCSFTQNINGVANRGLDANIILGEANHKGERTYLVTSSILGGAPLSEGRSATLRFRDASTFNPCLLENNCQTN